MRKISLKAYATRKAKAGKNLLDPSINIFQKNTLDEVEG